MVTLAWKGSEGEKPLAPRGKAPSKIDLSVPSSYATVCMLNSNLEWGNQGDRSLLPTSLGTAWELIKAPPV